VNDAPAFSSATEALEMARAAMGFLAAADATAMPASVQAHCLQTLEEVDAVETAARSSILGAFTAGQGYTADAAYSARAWLFHRTRITWGAARFHVSWAARAAAHPVVAAALAEPAVSEPWARVICGLTDRLPAPSRDEADAILIAAVRGGATLADLLALGQTMYERSRSGTPDGDGGDPGRAFEDRSVRLLTTIYGAGVLTGDLTPECAAVVSTVLDALSAPAGAGDTRTREQRYHDALAEAMRRLVAAGLVPDRAGQPARVLAHISLPDLLDLDTGSALMREWTARVRAQWAAARAAASQAGGDGGVWLEGQAAEAFACDATITPVVTGEVHLTGLDDLVRLCVELAGHGPGRCGRAADDTSQQQDEAGPGVTGPGGQDQPGHPRDSNGASNGASKGTAGRGSGPVPPTERGREALEQAIIGKAVELLSGPGGLASFLRRGLLGGRLGGPSLPLDVGRSADIPAAVRTAVRVRDQHCRFPDSCTQPASACEIHHITPKARGGKTSVKDCLLVCWHHHHIEIHQNGWTLILNPDGTTTAWNKERTKVLHSHGPPARAGQPPPGTAKDAG
jgi:Domain of unknown function (DUF222)